MTRLFFAVLMAALSSTMLQAVEQPLAFGSVRFEENRGQTDSQVQYAARTRTHQVFVTAKDVVFSPAAGPAIRMDFGGARPARWRPAGEAVDSISYYIGKDPAKWVKGAPMFDRLVWRGAYPGIDVMLYSRGEKIEYDLVLAPGADPSRVRLRFTGADRVDCDSSGAIEIGPKNAALRQNAPEIYQELSPGNRSRVEGRFVSAGAGEFKLELAAYQHAKPLIVDPVIEAASYVGGENEDEIVSATEGLVGGNTRSLSFPGAILALRRSRDMFLRGTGLLMPNRPNDAFFGTIVFGGSGDDELSAAVATRASSPQFLFAGVTKSTDFPVSDTSSYLGGASDGVVGGLSVSGLSHQVWSSYIGGSGEDRILSLTSGLSSYVIAGVTDSPNLPATNTLAGAKDGFVGAGSVFGGAASFQYVGGSADDSAYAVSLDNANRVWLGGETRSGDFPFNHGALQGSSDAFLASFRLPSFPSMVIDPLTFQRIGGSGDDAIRALAARRPTAAEDSSGVPLGNVPAFDGIGIAGVTTSTDLPVMNAAQGTLAGEQDIFVGMWGPADGLLWMTYVGGSGLEAATSIAQNWAGDLYVGGWTRSPDLSQVDAIQNGYAGGEDGLLAVFESRGKLSHLSYFGGSGDDRVNGVTLITNQVPRLVGSTTSADSPLTRSRTSRSEGMDGFIVDVGINHLIAPSSMVLAKDGMLSLNTLPGRTDLDLPITYRSSDPSRVRLVVDNRYYDEVTVIGGAVRVAALGDSGVVDLTATAEGYPVRTISVALYRGAFVPNTPALPISTWTPENTLFAPYQAIDPATGKPIGQSLALRPGMRAPVREWSVSDPSVMEIGVSRFGQPMLRALRPGEARVTLTVEGYEVVQVRDANLRAAHPQLAVQDFRLGKDLQTSMLLDFVHNQSRLPAQQRRGVVTVRSEDPNRLLVSTSGDVVGRASVTVDVEKNRQPVVYVQALSQEGQVRLVLTSSEFQGEFPLTVTLEPSVVRWGLRTFQGGQQVLSDDITLALGYQPTEISLVAAGESGSFGNIRPGVSPPTLTVSNSAPRVVEVSRVTLQLPTSLKIGGRAAGQAELSLTAAPGTMRVANRSLRVRVQDSATSRLTLPGPIVVGKDLQCVSSIGYDGHSLITITSSDPSALLLATTAQDRGSPEITLVPDTRGGPYTFYCSALKSLGEVRLSVRVAGETDREIKVRLTTSGVAIRAYNGATASGYQGAAQVYTAAVDEQSGVAVSAQKLQPGIMMPVRLRTEGASIRLAPDTFELSNEKDTGIFYFTNPEAGAESTIVAESGSGFAQARVSGRMRLRLNDSPTPPLTGRTRLPMMRDQLYELRFSIAAPAGTTITSSDPDKLVLSETQSSATGRSIQLAATASGIFLHALSESGSAMLRVEAPGHPTSELAVLFRPIAVVLNDVTLTKGGTGRLTPSLGVSALRPGVGPIRLNMRTADPAIATIKPAVVELTPYAPDIEVIGHSEGQTEIILEAPAGVSVTPASVIVEKQIPALVSGDIYRLGKNLQSSVELTVPQALRSENASILSISSSDPGRVLLSRSESGPGSPSINVALSAGAPATPRIFIQALDAEGETTLKATTAGVSQDLAVIRVVPSWLACNRSNQTLVLTRGQTSTYECYFAVPYYAETRTPPAVTLSGQPRSGSQILWPEIISTAPDIAAVKTVPDAVLTDRLIFQVTAVAVGEAELRVNQPAGFGPVADGSDVQPVRVEAPRLSASCGESDLAKRLQRTCTVTSQGGAQLAASAISGDPSLLSVKPGLVANSFILEALASAGTAEVLFTAPGYTDLRSAIVLRPVQVYIPPATATLRVGQTGSLSINTQGGAAAAGSDIAVTVTATPEGVIALEPARLRFEAGQSSTSLTIRGVSAGTAVLRFSGSEDVIPTGGPYTVIVTP